MDRAAELHEMSAQIKTATAVRLAYVQHQMRQISPRRQLSQVEVGHLAQLCSQGLERPRRRLDEHASRVGSKVHAGVSITAAVASLSSDQLDTARPIVQEQQDAEPVVESSAVDSRLECSVGWWI